MSQSASAPAPAPAQDLTAKPATNGITSRSDKEIAESTRHIREELLLLVVDDLAQQASSRREQGQGLFEAKIAYWRLVVANVKRFAEYFWYTWSSLIYGYARTSKSRPRRVALSDVQVVS